MVERTSTQLISLAEFQKMPESYERWELIDGKLIEKPGRTWEHGEIADRIWVAYRNFDPDYKLGRMLHSVHFKIHDYYYAFADLNFWTLKRVPKRDVQIAPHPDLAIEIQPRDQSLHKFVEKAQNYVKAGVRLVWLIQIDKQVANIFRPGQTEVEIIQPDGVLDGENIIPGFILPMANLFE